jgi:hypothetical protein
MTTHEELQQAMEFDHVIEVHADGSISDAPSDLYAPDMYDDSVSQPWTLMGGYSGQQSYAGPTMHASEYIGGRLADDILATPGYYVAIISCINSDDDDEGDEDIAGWAIARLPSHEVEHEDETDCPDMPHCPGHRQFAG